MTNPGVLPKSNGPRPSDRNSNGVSATVVVGASTVVGATDGGAVADTAVEASAAIVASVDPTAVEPAPLDAPLLHPAIANATPTAKVTRPLRLEDLWLKDLRLKDLFIMVSSLSHG